MLSTDEKSSAVLTHFSYVKRDMPTAHGSIDIDTGVSRVYARWTRFDKFPEFLRDVKSLSLGADRVSEWVVQVSGVERKFVAHSLEQVVDERIA